MNDGESGRKQGWRKSYVPQRLGNRGNQQPNIEGIS